MDSDAARRLAELEPRHRFFVGIDSDGCVFDTMEIKHKECFIPNTIRCWELQAVARHVREAAEFVNLYSRWRGTNRFPALVLTLDLVRARPEVIRQGNSVPEARSLRQFVASGLPLGNGALADYAARNPAPDLETALAWSDAVNRSIEEMVHGVPPFPHAREAIELLSGMADVVVVSATPGEALKREWGEHRLDGHVRAIAGQEVGTKADHVRLAAADKYAPDHILVIGDAPGDLEAARANGAAFFPIYPGEEDSCWEQLRRDVLPRFLAGEYAGAEQAARIAEFQRRLPERPPWEMASAFVGGL